MHDDEDNIVNDKFVHQLYISKFLQFSIPINLGHRLGNSNGHQLNQCSVKIAENYKLITAISVLHYKWA